MGIMPNRLPSLDHGDLAKQIELLRVGSFHFDRAPRAETWRAAAALVAAGLLESWESGSDAAQYTAINFRITDLGRVALDSFEQRAAAAEPPLPPKTIAPEIANG